MALVERWGKLDVAGAGQAVLVLDASDSARDRHQDIVALAQQVLGRLPARQPRSLFFLGNGQECDPAKLGPRAAQLLRENERRASLISPVLRAVPAAPGTRLAVIGAGEIFDLDDWAEHAHAASLLLATVGAPMQPAGGPARSVKDDLLEAVCQHLSRRAEKVVIGGPAFLPLSWSNPEYALDESGPEPALVARDADDYGLTLRYLSEASPAGAQVFVGEEESGVELAPAAAVAAPQVRLATLTGAERTVFEKARRHEKYSCPCCQQEHDWKALRCPCSGGIIGTLVYPSLSDDFTGLAVFRERAGAVEVFDYGARAVRLAPDRVALLAGGQARIWRFDAAQRRWLACPEERLEPYTRVENGDYAVIL